tara:strand:+ start:1121 stop:1303 length:183 start_codon:yes stop_codon:yes gene_type:complete
MKKIFKLFKGLTTLGFCITAGYYGLDMFIMYLNPMHLIMLGLSFIFSLITIEGIIKIFKL